MTAGNSSLSLSLSSALSKPTSNIVGACSFFSHCRSSQRWKRKANKREPRRDSIALHSPSYVDNRSSTPERVFVEREYDRKKRGKS